MIALRLIVDTPRRLIGYSNRAGTDMLPVVSVCVMWCRSSVGCTVQGETPRAIQEKIDSKDIVIPDE